MEKRTLRDGRYTVTTPHFKASFTIKGGEVSECAPILLPKLSYWMQIAVRTGP